MSSDTNLLRTLLVLTTALGIAACGSDRDDSPSAAGPADRAADRAESIQEDAEDAMDEAMDDAEEAADDAATDAMAADTDDDPCTLTITAGDTIAYDRNSMSVPSSCDDVTVTLKHTGNLPAAAMGHNWVLVPSGTANEIGMAGMSAGLDSDYLPDDDRIVAATSIIGGGESDSVSFSLADLDDGTDYVYVCTFPGHWSIMKGTFTVTN